MYSRTTNLIRGILFSLGGLFCLSVGIYRLFSYPVIGVMLIGVSLTPCMMAFLAFKDYSNAQKN